MPNFVVVIDTGFIGAEHEVDVHVPDAEWDAMTPEEQEKYRDDEIQDAINSNISGTWKTAEEHYG